MVMAAKAKEMAVAEAKAIAAADALLAEEEAEKAAAAGKAQGKQGQGKGKKGKGEGGRKTRNGKRAARPDGRARTLRLATSATSTPLARRALRGGWPCTRPKAAEGCEAQPAQQP